MWTAQDIIDMETYIAKLEAVIEALAERACGNNCFACHAKPVCKTYGRGNETLKEIWTKWAVDKAKEVSDAR